MPGLVHSFLISLLILPATATAGAQEAANAANSARNLKPVVVSSETKSDSVIVVPPATSVTISLKSGKPSATADAVNLPVWLSGVRALNGLESSDVHPWHVVLTYDQFDEVGDNVHSGVYEEYWASPAVRN